MGINLDLYEEEVLADTFTPVSAYLCIRDSSPSFLLESAEGGGKWGRFSFIGFSSMFQISYKDGDLEIKGKNEVFKKVSTPDPFPQMREFIRSFNLPPLKALPRFPGGMVGYLGYDMIRCWENLPQLSRRDLDVPDAFFIIPEYLLIYDHLTHKLKMVSFINLEEKSREEGYREGRRKMEEIRELLSRNNVKLPSRIEIASLRSNFTPSGFKEAVRRVKKYIREGDIIQAVISQRWKGKVEGDVFSIYRALRSINPSPYMFYLDFGNLRLLGASPEVLVRKEGEVIEVRPIAGTRPRGKTEEEDRYLEEELLSDEKERAEHIMLVDLARNDVGRVAKGGSVEVTELMVVERYSHVMHIVSHVRGIIAPGEDEFSTVSATFPAGTVTGAPKVRAMEIIEEMEPTRRGPYAGAVGYFSFTGNADFCITIRSMLEYGGYIYLQTGAGIVADSQPDREYEETVNKARAILKAFEWSKEGLR